MNRTRWNLRPFSVRRTVYLLLLLTPLLALPLFTRHALQPVVEKSEPSAALQSPMPVSMMSTRNAAPALSILSNQKGDVEVSISEATSKFADLPMCGLSEAIKNDPDASRFHVSWSVLGPGCIDYYSMWYDRKEHTIRCWCYCVWPEAGPPRRTGAVYRRVKDRTIDRIAAVDASEHKSTVEDLTNYGCTCRGSGCPTK